MDTLSEEICDVINQALDSSSFMFTFPGEFILLLLQNVSLIFSVIGVVEI